MTERERPSQARAVQIGDKTMSDTKYIKPEPRCSCKDYGWEIMG